MSKGSSLLKSTPKQACFFMHEKEQTDFDRPDFIEAKPSPYNEDKEKGRLYVGRS